MDKLAEVIASLAQQLGMEAGRLWPEVVRVAYYRALAELIVMPVFFIGLASFSAYCLTRGYRKHLECNRSSERLPDTHEGWYIVGFISLVLTGLVLFAMFIVIPIDISVMMAPEGTVVLRLIGK